MSLHRWTGLVVASVALAVGACGGGEDEGDTGVMSLGPATAGDDGSGGDGSGTAAVDDGASGADDGADDGADSTSGGADDAMMDSGADDGAACDPACAPGEQCIAGNCVGGMDDGGSETGTPGECGTNVSTMNAECDACAQDSCCMQLQACFGDETVMMNTPCLDLNNCIAMNCAEAATAEELQTCVDEMCMENAGEFQTWVAFISCVGMNCMMQCAG